MGWDGEPLIRQGFCALVCTVYLGFWVRVSCQATAAMVVQSLGLPMLNWLTDGQSLAANAQLAEKRKEKKRQERTTPFGVNVMRSQVLYRAAQGLIG